MKTNLELIKNKTFNLVTTNSKFKNYKFEVLEYVFDDGDNAHLLVRCEYYTPSGYRESSNKDNKYKLTFNKYETNQFLAINKLLTFTIDAISESLVQLLG